MLSAEHKVFSCHRYAGKLVQWVNFFHINRLQDFFSKSTPPSQKLNSQPLTDYPQQTVHILPVQTVNILHSLIYCTLSLYEFLFKPAECSEVPIIKLGKPDGFHITHDLMICFPISNVLVSITLKQKLICAISGILRHGSTVLKLQYAVAKSGLLQIIYNLAQFCIMAKYAACEC